MAIERVAKIWTETLFLHVLAMPNDIETALQACERQLDVHLTVLDLHGMLYDQHNQSLLNPRWRTHRRHDACKIGFNKECIAHCRWQIGERWRTADEPIITNCWKGIREIACPLRWQDYALGTLFAGRWRTVHPPVTAAGLSAAWRASWDTLPVFDERTVRDKIPVLRLFATGLAERIAHTMLPRHGDLRSRIDIFMRLNRALPLQISDLAAHLERSPSRTAAVVRELFGQPFAKVLRRIRIDNAKFLLERPEMSIADIAHDVGFDDPLYFSRCFKAETGQSPKAWRQNRN